MEKFEINNGTTILWTIGTTRWLINYKELIKTYVSGKHPFTNAVLSTATMKKLLQIVRMIAGGFTAQKLQICKTFKKIPLEALVKLKSSGKKLGSGKYATVYDYNGFAVKVINHKFYKDIPRIDGELEAKILNLLRQKIVWTRQCPNIITMYQFTPSNKTDYIVLEKLDQTLWSFIQTEPSKRKLLGCIVQVLFALLILQSSIPGFRHNDLKVDNILLDFTPKTETVTLVYKDNYWIVPADIPLVKIADFDYSCVPGKHPNPKVGTTFATSFGCTERPSKVYDTHLFLNSLYSYRRKLGSEIAAWLTDNLPAQTRGNDSKGVKYGRLRDPSQWERVIKTPYPLLRSPIFSEFKTTRLSRPYFG